MKQIAALRHRQQSKNKLRRCTYSTYLGTVAVRACCVGELRSAVGKDKTIDGLLSPVRVCTIISLALGMPVPLALISQEP